MSTCSSWQHITNAYNNNKKKEKKKSSAQCSHCVGSQAIIRRKRRFRGRKRQWQICRRWAGLAFVMLSSVCQANEPDNICQSRGCRSGVGSLDQVLKFGRPEGIRQYAWGEQDFRRSALSAGTACQACNTGKKWLKDYPVCDDTL